MNVGLEIIKEAERRTNEKIRHNQDGLLGETIATVRRECIEALLSTKGYITLDDVHVILESGWLSERNEPISLEFDVSDEIANFYA